MGHIAPLTRTPGTAETIAPEVKLTFIRDVIEVSIPLFENKNPSNPVDTTT